ncbi:MAG: GntR family transcriptional regulator [Candidatus Velthaea sp.]
MAEYAYEYTKGLLFEGALQPGQRVRVEDVVTRLNTSRQPVMDAFKRLASEGFLEIIPQVGCRVVTPTRDEIADFFLILAGVEGTAADIAARRRTDDDLAAMHAIVRDLGALRNAPETPDRCRAFRDLKRAFHEAVHAMAHSQSISNIAASLWDRSDFYVSTLMDCSASMAARIAGAHDEHVAILDAIEQRDPQAARLAMERHIAAYEPRSAHEVKLSLS